MIKIGITGGIGAGKSVVCGIFQHFGIQVYNADLKTRELMNNSPDLKRLLIFAYGKEIFKNNELDRIQLAKLAFEDNKTLESLNSIVHPFVQNDFNNWHENQPGSYVIIESAILFESNFHRVLDSVIEIYAPLNERIQRTVNRDKTIANEVIKRVNNQMDEEEKKRKANYVIYNDGSQLLIPQVLELHHKFLTYSMFIQ